MQRAQFSMLVGLFCFFGITACTENPNDLKRLPNGRSSLVVTSGLSLDANIAQLLALFPTDLSARNEQRSQQGANEDLNPVATWNTIKQKYAAAGSDPAKMKAVKALLFRLSNWVTRNAQEMNTPPSSETKTAAAARLVLYMSMYVYAGPTTAPPSYLPGADAAVGVVTPGAPATIVTPTLHAGVQLEAGSVSENTVIVVTQNPTDYPVNCSGPLPTKFCQYPQFYTFDAFPDNALLKPAKVNVCHVNFGTRRRLLLDHGTLIDHARLRPAHTKPANSADYVDGSTIRDGIEILPLVEQTFSTCVDNGYANDVVPQGALGLITRVARGLKRIVSPEPAYAIDLGLGGLVKKFSPFNDVDSLSAPDLKVQNVAFAPATVHPGDHVAITYTISNIGTATNTVTPTAVRLSTDATLTPADVSVAPIALPFLPPESTVTVTQTVVIPDTTTVGPYYLGVAIQSDPAFPDANLLNNQLALPLTVEPSFVSLRNTLSVGAYTGCALSASNTTYCWGANNLNQFGTTFNSGPSAFPFASNLLPSFAMLSGGAGQHLCGITSSGSARCWGRADFGALGSGADIPTIGSEPVTVAGGINWASINMSRLSGCGVSTGNTGYCWGSNQRGELGKASIPPVVQPAEGDGLHIAFTTTPHILDGNHLWKSVVAGWLHACGINTAGVAHCWGDNAAGQLGLGAADDLFHIVPAPVVTTERFIQLSLGTRSTCGITVNHQAFCWGENGTGQIGDGTTSVRAVPTPVAGGQRFSYIAVSPGFLDGTDATPPQAIYQLGNMGHTCALTETGSPYCWGLNGRGQLGDGTTTDHLTPQAVAGGFSFASIALGGSATCGRRGNQIWCWGSNALGQLGNGTRANSSTPVLVSSPFNVP